MEKLVGATVLLALVASCVAHTLELRYEDESMLMPGGIEMGDFALQQASGGSRKLLQLVIAQPLLHAIALKNETRVKELLAEGADPNVLSQDGRWTPLILAAIQDLPDIVRILLNAGAEVDLRNNRDDTALELAAVRSSLVTVKVLLGAGADPNNVDSVGLTPLHRSLIYGHTDVIKALLDAGADIEGPAQLRFGTHYVPPLHIAALNGHLGAVKLLLKEGAEVDATESLKNSTALFSAARYGNGVVMLELIDAGAVVDHRDSEGSTALFLGAYYGHLRSIEVLLESGADNTIVNNSGWTAYAVLCQCIFGYERSLACDRRACDSALTIRMSDILDPM